MILAAVYRGELAKEAVSGRLAVGGLRAQYDLRVFERATRVRIPLRTEGTNLLPGSVLLDGRPIESDWEADATALAFDVAEPGDYRLGAFVAAGDARRGGIGRIRRGHSARGRIAARVGVPADAPPMEVPSACGGVSLEKDPPRLLGRTGTGRPIDRSMAGGRGAAGPGWRSTPSS